MITDPHPHPHPHPNPSPSPSPSPSPNQVNEADMTEEERKEWRRMHPDGVDWSLTLSLTLTLTLALALALPLALTLTLTLTLTLSGSVHSTRAESIWRRPRIPHTRTPTNIKG